jgi:hypothetical protein
MLNVLCQKTLEQARMEVLEETELEIIKQQQKEYDERVNAELITAQRYEAKEHRHTEEVSRRQIQDQARKKERKDAHKKINARSFAKNYLFGIRDEAIKEVASMGLLVAPKVRHIEEEVMPWLMDRVVDFLYQDTAVNQHSDKIVDLGFSDSLN